MFENIKRKVLVAFFSIFASTTSVVSHISHLGLFFSGILLLIFCCFLFSLSLFFINQNYVSVIFDITNDNNDDDDDDDNKLHNNNE